MPQIPEIVTTSDIQKNTTPQSTQLTKLIEEKSKVFGQMKGIIKSSNIEEFSMWFVETCKPQWQDNGKTGFYTPSAIVGIAKKILGLDVGTFPSQRDRIRVLREIIREIQNEHKGSVSINDIIVRSEKSGLKKDTILDMMEKLKSAGEIFEASNNRFRVA